MITIKKFEVNPLGENTYIVSDETKECMIVDDGAFYQEEKDAIDNYISENSLKPVVLALTHAHFDHVFGISALYNKYGLKPTLHAKDEKIYNSYREHCNQMLGINIESDLPPVERYVKDGDEVKFGNQTFKVLETSGHTPGSVFYYSKDEKIAFSGDTLFRGSIGRTDLPGGSMFQIIQSLRMVTQLPDDTRILSGHGLETTIGFELASNPYLDR